MRKAPVIVPGDDSHEVASLVDTDDAGTTHESSAAAVMKMPPADEKAPVRAYGDLLPAFRGDGIPTALARLVSVTINSVAGCWAVSATHDQRPQPQASSSTPDLLVEWIGWSPSLHQTLMQATVPLRGRDPASPEAAAIVRDQVGALAADQRRRGNDAAAIGITAPLAIADTNTPIGHLTADRSALALASLRHGHFTHDVLAAAVGLLHRNSTAMLASLRHGYLPRGVLAPAVGLLHGDPTASGGLMQITGHGILVRDERGTQHLGWSAGLPTRERSTKGRLVDEDLIITGITLPETLLAAATGRRVGDVVAAHPLLDERVIAKAVQAGPDDQTITIRLARDRVRLADLA